MSDMAVDQTPSSARLKAERSAVASSVADEVTPEGRSFPKPVYILVSAIIVVIAGMIMGYFMTGGFGASESHKNDSPLGALTPPPYGSNAIPQPTDPPAIPHQGSNAVSTAAPIAPMASPDASATRGPLPGPTVPGTFPPTPDTSHLGDPVNLSKVPGLNHDPESADPSPIPTAPPPAVRGAAVAIAAAPQPAVATPAVSSERDAPPSPAISTPKSEAVYQHHTTGLPPSPYALRGGWEVSAAFTAALSSDMPGTVRAIQTRDVFASYVSPGLTPPCSWPAGTQLTGHFEGVKTSSDTRLFAVWTNVAFPNGHEITLPDLAATDAAGANGVTGNVDHHTGRSIGTSVLVTLMQAALTYGTQPRFVVQGQTMGPLPIIGQAASSALTPLAARAVEQSLDHVTISKNPGDRVDLLIYPGIDLGESEC